LERLAAEKWIRPDQEVVIFNTGAAQKYPEAMQVDLPRLKSATEVDWIQILN
jgi:threonine synthase